MFIYNSTLQFIVLNLYVPLSSREYQKGRGWRVLCWYSQCGRALRMWPKKLCYPALYSGFTLFPYLWKFKISAAKLSDFQVHHNFVRQLVKLHFMSFFNQFIIFAYSNVDDISSQNCSLVHFSLRKVVSSFFQA